MQDTDGDGAISLPEGHEDRDANNDGKLDKYEYLVHWVKLVYSFGPDVCSKEFTGDFLNENCAD